MTNSWDLSMHHEGTSVCVAGSSASTATTWPTGTSLIRSASMMIGIGHFRPMASIVSAGAGAAAGVGRRCAAGCCGRVTRVNLQLGLTDDAAAGTAVC